MVSKRCMIAILYLVAVSCNKKIHDTAKYIVEFAIYIYSHPGSDEYEVRINNDIKELTSTEDHRSGWVKVWRGWISVWRGSKEEFDNLEIPIEIYLKNRLIDKMVVSPWYCESRANGRKYTREEHYYHLTGEGKINQPPGSSLVPTVTCIFDKGEGIGDYMGHGCTGSGKGCVVAERWADNDKRLPDYIADDGASTLRISSNTLSICSSVLENGVNTTLSIATPWPESTPFYFEYNEDALKNHYIAYRTTTYTELNENGAIFPRGEKDQYEIVDKVDGWVRVDKLGSERGEKTVGEFDLTFTVINPIGDAERVRKLKGEFSVIRADDRI
jgi:hypothetical protein